MKQQGFSLVEILVALAIFTTIFVLTSGYLVSAISGQREALGVRPLVNESSFLAEYLSRALRPAQKAQDANCLSAVDMYYEALNANTAARFLDKENRCREISYDSVAKRITERISPDETANFGPEEALTSLGLQAQAMRFEVADPASPEGIPHPRITVTMELRPAGDTDANSIRLQTTISQREF